MNIFYLDQDIQTCAVAHCDKHVIKMILESAQILCSVLHKTGQDAPYRLTHRNHPCVLWAGESLENWLWLRDLTAALNQEYKFRFNHITDHKSFTAVYSLDFPVIGDKGMTERPQVMPEIYQTPGDPITAYRQYYMAEKAHLLNYTKRKLPEWLSKKNS